MIECLYACANWQFKKILVLLSICLATSIFVFGIWEEIAPPALKERNFACTCMQVRQGGTCSYSCTGTGLVHTVLYSCKRKERTCTMHNTKKNTGYPVRMYKCICNVKHCPSELLQNPKNMQCTFVVFRV